MILTNPNIQIILYDNDRSVNGIDIIVYPSTNPKKNPNEQTKLIHFFIVVIISVIFFRGHMVYILIVLYYIQGK